MTESDSVREHKFEYAKEKVTQEDEENLEQLLFLLDKFCVTDELYHELTILYNDLPRSYLIKQKRPLLHRKSLIKLSKSSDLISEYTPGSHKGISQIKPKSPNERAYEGQN